MSEEDTKDILEEWKRFVFPHTSDKHTSNKSDVQTPSQQQLQSKELDLSEHEEALQNILTQILAKKYGKRYAKAVAPILQTIKVPFYAVAERSDLYRVSYVPEFKVLNEFSDLIEKPKLRMVVLFAKPPTKLKVLVTSYQVRLGRKKLRDGSLSMYVKAFECKEENLETEEKAIENQITMLLSQYDSLKEHHYEIGERYSFFDYNHEDSAYEFAYDVVAKCLAYGNDKIFRSVFSLKDFEDVMRFVNLGVLNMTNPEDVDALVSKKHYKNFYEPNSYEQKSLKESNNEVLGDETFSITRVRHNLFYITTDVPTLNRVSFFAEVVELDWELYDIEFFCNPKHIPIVNAFNKKYRSQLINMVKEVKK
jgi:hypothetical protein